MYVSLSPERIDGKSATVGVYPSASGRVGLSINGVDVFVSLETLHRLVLAAAEVLDRQFEEGWRP